MPTTPRKRPVSEVAGVTTPEKVARRALAPLHWPKISREENILRDFDLSLKYGPSRGLTRLQRYNRAVKFNLEPPAEVLALLTSKESQTSVLDDHRL
jgi:DNA polymerase delta, subunit 4